MKFPQNYLVSIVIPTYSRPENLIRAINSVIRQTYKNLEIIVVDDNGLGTEWQIQTENLLHDLINNKTIIYIAHDSNRNGSAARNTGMKASHGELINFLDDDDEFSENKIERCVEKLVQDKECDGVFCDTIFISEDRKQTFINPNSSFPAADLLLGKLKFNTSTLLFRKDTLLEINGFDESFLRHQDYELIVRYCEKFTLIKADGCFLIKHETDNIITRNPLKTIEFLKYFINKFNPIFRTWPNGNQVIRHRYEVAARDLAAAGFIVGSLKCLYGASSFGMPSAKVIVKCIYHILKNKLLRN